MCLAGFIGKGNCQESVREMEKKTTVQGRIWIVADEKGKLVDDIDTDQIFHNKHLAVTDQKEMGRYAFGNLKGWEEFPQKAEPGDILVVGSNFGAGSSRQQAVDCFASLGIAAIVGESFGAIYKRNAINSGFPILECPEIGGSSLKTGDSIQIDFLSGEIRKAKTGNLLGRANPFSRVQKDIFLAGNLFAYGRTL